MLFFRKIFLFCIIFFYLFSNVFSNFFIIEIFPNTTDDVNLEYLSIYNSGNIQKSLSGFYLEDKSEKKYFFGSGEIFGSGETKKYFRTKTKILLNNSSEEIYLKNNSGEIIDNFNYNSSEKSYIYKKKFYSDEVKIEERYFSGTLDDLIGTGNINNSSGSLDYSSSGELISSGEVIDSASGELVNSGIVENNTGANLLIPEVKIEVQSGLDFLTGAIYECPEKGEGTCKINLNLEKIFSGIYDKNNYLCEWNFGSGAVYSTGTELKCNPGYVDYGAGEYEILAKVFEKNNLENYNSGSIKILNILDDTLIGTGVINTSPQPSPFKEKELNVFYSFQNPSYLLEKELDFGSGEIIYNCDRDKEKCKVNLDFRYTFGSGITESDFSCEIDFGFGTGNLTGEENKCNPNTIEIPIGNFDVNYKIFNKGNNNYFGTGTFKIINEGYLKPIKKSSGSSSSNSRKSEIYIPEIKIEVQSGLDENLKCDKKLCNINFKYDDLGNDVICKWDFGNAIFDEKLENKCNPGYVKYAPGKYEIKLKVIDKNYENNFKIKSINIENIYREEKLKSIITLQGKISKNKVLIGNKIICSGIKECSVNFTGEESRGEIEKYIWDLGNGEIIEKRNPLSKKYGIGEYKVSLKVYDENNNFDISFFEIEVLENKIEKEKIEEIKIEKLNNFSLEKNKIILKNKLKEISKNIFKNKNIKQDFLNKKLEFKNNIVSNYNNNFKQTIRKNKNYISVYGNTFPNKKILINKTIDFPLFGKYFSENYELKTDENGKYKLKLDYEKFGKYNFKTYVLDEKLGYIEINKTKKLEISEEKYLTNIYENEIKNHIDEKIENKIILTKNDLEKYSKIIVQGKIGKNKILGNNYLTCIDTCSINFGLEKNNKNIKYIWDFGNGKTLKSNNPGYIKYDNFGKYKVNLSGYDIQGRKLFSKYFVVDFIKKVKAEKTNNKKEKYEKIDENTIEINKNEFLTENQKTYGIYFIIFIILLSIFLVFLILRREKII